MFVSKWATVAKNALLGDGMTVLLLKTHFRTEPENLELCAVRSEHFITLQSPAYNELGSRGTANI